MKKVTNWIANHRVFTVILLLLFMLAVIVCFYFSTTYINLSKVENMHISISNYNLNDPTKDKFVLEIDNQEQFEETQRFIHSVQELSGYNPFKNRGRWYTEIRYTYKSGKTKDRIISGDQNFEELTAILQEFQNNRQ